MAAIACSSSPPRRHHHLTHVVFDLSGETRLKQEDKSAETPWRKLVFKVSSLATAATIAASVLATPTPIFAQEPGLTPTTIKIGMFGPLSGPSMAYGFDV